MKARIDARAGAEGKDDLKLGKGGIREVEFFVSALQLLHAGREEARTLRERAVLPALDRLLFAGVVPPKDRDELADAYLFLRRAEHRVQMVDGRADPPAPAGRRAPLARPLHGLPPPRRPSRPRSPGTASAWRGSSTGSSGPATGAVPLDPDLALLADPAGRAGAARRDRRAARHRRPGPRPRRHRRAWRAAGPPSRPSAIPRRRWRSSPTPSPRRIRTRRSRTSPTSPPRSRTPSPTSGCSPSTAGWRGCSSRSSGPPTSSRSASCATPSSSTCCSARTRSSSRRTGTPSARSSTSGSARSRRTSPRTTLLERSLGELRRYKNEEVLRIAIHDIAGTIDLASVAGQLTELAEVLLERCLALAEQEARGEGRRAARAALRHRDGEARRARARLPLRPRPHLPLPRLRRDGGARALPAPRPALHVVPPDAAPGGAALPDRHAAAPVREPGGARHRDRGLHALPHRRRGGRVGPGRRDPQPALGAAGAAAGPPRRRRRGDLRGDPRARPPAGGLRPPRGSGRARRRDPADARADGDRGRTRGLPGQEPEDRPRRPRGRRVRRPVPPARPRARSPVGAHRLHAGRAPQAPRPPGSCARRTSRRSREGYDFLRRVELRLRIVHDFAIDHLPEEGAALRQLARRLGYAGPDPGGRFLGEYARVTAAVRRAFDAVVA